MSEALHIALDVSAVPDQLTGAGVYTLELARALGARDDVLLDAVSRRSDAARWSTLPGLSVQAVVPDPMGRRLLFGEVGLGRAVRGRASLLHGPHYTMPRDVKVPAVVTVHDLTLLEHPEWHERSKVWFFSHAIRYAAEHAAAIVCVSEHTARRLISRLDPRAPVRVVHHGIDHARFGPLEPVAGSDDTALQPFGLAARYILHLGTIEPRKNLVRLVAAFDRQADDDDEIELVLAGATGWQSGELDRAIASSAHTRRIRRLGYVPALTVPALLRRATVVAYPSIEEGFGLPALEALACGAPLVTSSESVMAELAGEAAWCCLSNDVEAIAEALGRAAASDRARSAVGIARAALFTWEAAAEGHVGVYREALA